MAPPTAFTHSFMSAACTGSSSSKRRAETACSAGRAFSRAAAGPPATRTICACSAAVLEPRIGHDTNRTPFFSVRSWTERVMRVPQVDRSTSTSPSASPARTPSAPPSTASSAPSSETQVKTRSRPVAHSRAVAASFPPLETMWLAFAGVRFHTVRSCPAFRRLLAMGSPMVPRPTKPIRIRMRPF